MAENAKENKSSKTVIILLLIIIFLLLAGGIIAAVFLLGKEDDVQSDDDISGRVTLPYEAGAVMMDEESLQKQVEAMHDQADEGIGVRYKRVAVSNDGENFVTEIGNSISNSYDMYLDIYMDDSLEEEIYVSGLLQPGASIYEFKINKKLDPGEYESVLVFTQVEDDHATLHAQTMVYMTLLVN